MNISKHITLKEATASATGTRLNIVNEPSEETLKVMRITAEKLFEPIREHFGEPIVILSFYRSPELNKAVGGAKSSQHMTGEAIDVKMTGSYTNADLWNYLKQSDLEFCQAIWEFGDDEQPDWIHISYATVTRTNKCEFLRAKKINGKTIYIPF